MLYVKYRPKSFKEIIRPNLEVDNLLSKLKSGTLGHAHILAGSRGVGKTTLARLLANGLNCLQFEDDVCGDCVNCKSIKSGNFIDIIEIDGASNRKIEDARELREQIKFPPLRGQKKVIIIDEVHMLTNEAFNALLKSIEEPPEYIVFILCTTEVQKIPETIRSRCQISFLSRPSDSQIIEKLKLIAAEESMQVSEYDLEMIARSANGGYRDAETLLTQIQGGVSGEIMENYYSYKNYIQYLGAVFDKDIQCLLEFHQNLEEKGIDIVKWLGLYISFLRSSLYLSLERYVSRENKFNPEDKKALTELLQGKGLKVLSNHVMEYIDLYSRMRYSQTPLILMEVFLINNLIVSDTLSEDIAQNKEIIKIENKNINETKSTEITPNKQISETAKNNLKKAISGNLKQDLTEGQDKAVEFYVDIKEKIENKEMKAESLELLERKLTQPDYFEENSSVSAEEEAGLEEGQGGEDGEILEETSKISPSSPSFQTFSLTIDQVKENWGQVLSELVQTNKPLESILRQAVIVSFDGQTVFLESPYKFHSERLSLNSNKLILEEIMNKIYNQKVLYKCSLTSAPNSKKNLDEAFSMRESLTDYNVTAPENLSDGDILSLFNGGVPVTR